VSITRLRAFTIKQYPKDGTSELTKIPIKAFTYKVLRRNTRSLEFASSMDVHHSRYDDTLYLKRSVKSDPPSSIRTEDVRKAGASAPSAVGACPSIALSAFGRRTDSKLSKFRSSLLSLSSLLPFPPTLYMRTGNLLVGRVASSFLRSTDEVTTANAKEGRATKEIQRVSSSSAIVDQRNRTILQCKNIARPVGPHVNNESRASHLCHFADE
jgi:hypothetical protein